MHETKAFSVTEVNKFVPGDTQGLGLPPHHLRMSRLRVQLKASKLGRQVCWGQNKLRISGCGRIDSGHNVQTGVW
jgi:hypothetical protein